MTFREAAKLQDVPEGEPVAVEVDDQSLVLVRDGQTVYCIEDRCSHGAVALSEGDVDMKDVTIECYLHGSTFDLTTGVPQCLPATEPVPVFTTKIEGETIWVELPKQGVQA